MSYRHARASPASVDRKVGAVGHFDQAVPIDNGNDLPPSTDKAFPFESLYRHCHNRSVHAKHDGEKPVCERYLRSVDAILRHE
jgi:hypothetical protein